MKNYLLKLSTLAILAASIGVQAETLDYSGQIERAVGNEYRRESQPCSVTIGSLDKNSAKYYFQFGDTTTEIYGVRDAKKSRINFLSSDLVYVGPKVRLDNSLIRYEVLSLEISKDQSSLALNRKIYEYREQSFYSATLSNMTCEAKLTKRSE